MLTALVLGLIQGLTEFLPVSSSGHLVLAHHFLGFATLPPAFDVFVQGGTVLSLLWYFRTRLTHLSWHLLFLLALATFPAALVGLLLHQTLDTLFSSLNYLVLGFFLTTTTLILSRFSPRETHPLPTASQALLIGLVQACALLPGLSRSGVTVTTSLLLGLSPASAFEFSFLLAIPTILGASLLGAHELTWNSLNTPIYLVGFFLAAVSGYFALILLNRLLRRGEFARFAPYTLALTLLTLFLLRSN